MSAVQIHLHTWYSLRDSIANPKEIVARVKKLGQTAVACTDHGTTSGLLDMYLECKKQDIKLVFGYEGYYVPDVTIKDKYKHINFWAINNEGYKNLLSLSTEASKNFYKKPRVDIDIIKKYNKGLLCSTACLGGWIRTDDNEVNEDLFKQFLDIFGDRLYIEIHTYSNETQKEWNKQLIELHKKYPQCKLVVACDSHYVTKEQAYTHKMFITQGKEREDGYYQTPEFFIHSEQEMIDALSYLPKDIVIEAVNNTQELADRCHIDIDFSNNHYPKIDVKDEEEAVLEILRKNWRTKLPDKSMWDVHAKRIKEEEMPVLKQAGYYSYFLMFHDLVETLKQNDIPISWSSRGSAGGCDTAFVMDIQRTDPVKYDLLFSRFLHSERVTPCDIDLDVSQEYRPQVIDILKKKYGEDKIFKSRTFGRMGWKGAVRTAAKCLGYDENYIRPLIKAVGDSNEDEELQDMNIDKHKISLVDTTDEVKELASNFLGIISNYSAHASAIIVFPDDASNYSAVEYSAKDGLVTAYEFHTLEKLGILKLDILGIKTIDVIQKTLEQTNVDLNNLPLDDKKTFDMLCQGKTAGVFQIEGKGFTNLVKRIQPKHFEDLAPLMAVYRPAIIDAGLLDVYINRRNGEEQVEYLMPELEEILKPTYGIALYQEQIIAIGKEIAGYTAGQADMLRRAVGRKLPEEMEKIKPDFIERVVSKGHSKDKAIELFELIEFFAGYGFGKAHSYGYGYTSYVTAYLKANYTKEFMVSLINSEQAQEKVVPYIEELKRLNIELLPPSLKVGNRKWCIEGNALRVGLEYIKGVGTKLCTEHSDTFEDIILHNSKAIVIPLIKAGALDYLGVSRAYLLSSFADTQDMLKRVKQCEEKIEQYTLELPSTKAARMLLQWQTKLKEAQEQTMVTVDSYNQTEGEYQVLSFTFSSIPKVKTGKAIRVYTKNDKNNNEMAWVTFDTPYGERRVTIFASQWKRFKVIKDNTYVFVEDEKGILKEIKNYVDNKNLK